MKRQIADEHVAKIKLMLTQNYRTVSIIDIMKQKFGVVVNSDNIGNIKKLKAYKDVRPDLNSALRTTYPIKTRYDTYDIEVIKWALEEGYSFYEIMQYYNVSKNMLMQIKSGRYPNYNSQIKKRAKRKKRANIDKKMVIAIKKEYKEKNGNVSINEIAKKHKINQGTVSAILNLKCYKEAGISFNSKINSIKKKKEAAKEATKKKKLKLKIDKEKQNIQSLLEKKKEIEEKLKESNAKLKNIRAAS